MQFQGDAPETQECAVTDVTDYLEARGITSEVAELAGLFDVPNAAEVYPDFRRLPAIVIPYLDIHGEPIGFERDGDVKAFCRVRYMGDLGAGRRGKKPVRYTQPADSGVRAYFPPGADWSALAADPSEPLLITEGEIKALAVTSYVSPCIGLGGVNSTVRDGKFLPELAEFVWEGREVYICFDSDAIENPRVVAAESRLVQELQTERGARCRLMRIPPGEGGAKMGIDDYLVTYGASAVLSLVAEAQDLYALDAKVIGLNSSIAWIEQEGMIYDLEGHAWMTKDNLVSGGKYSHLTHYLPGKKGGDAKKVQVAKTWLTHPHAQRYARAIFKPGEGDIVLDDQNQPSMNLWTGLEERPGDVQPFLDLAEFLFQRVEPADREFFVKLFAYKFQHPEEKIPLCPVLIGPQGCGKSLLARCIREAAGPYGTTLESAALGSDFSEWQENSLIVTIDEAEESHMQKGKDVLKSMISEQKRRMNVKYRSARAIFTYFQFIITSNNRAAGAFTADDRRMFVVDCPAKREEAFYLRVVAWLAAGGGKCLAYYLTHYDLAGWKPPAQAPATAEKHMAYVEGLSPAQRFAEGCATANENAVKQWLDAAVAWAEVNVAGNNPALAGQARQVLDSAGQWQVRPFYTPEELYLMLPMLIAETGGGRVQKRTGPGEISRQLRDAGITYLQCSDDPRGFRWRGKVHQFLVVAEPDDWQRPLSQDEFDRVMKDMPRYSQIRARSRA